MVDSSLTADGIQLKAVKGNGLAELITEYWAAKKFQPLLYNGLDVNKAVRVKKGVAALGCRGDYIDVEVPCSDTGTTDVALTASQIYVELIDFTGVPTAVQHTLFGEFSPFVTPKSSMQESMLDGIDRQEIEAVTNVDLGAGAATTLVSQEVRGEADARVQAKANALKVISGVTLLTLRLKPNTDGVFYIPPGSVIWVEPDTDALYGDGD